MSHKKLLLLFCLGIFLSPGRNVNAQSKAFVYTGSVQSWTVPCGVATITVDMAGAQGGSTGGKGGRVQCTYTTTPGTVLNVYVGGQGAASASAALGGFNGGGNAGTSNGGSFGSGGGGASDIRANGVALTNRIIVAGGGGGINTDNNAPGVGGGLIGGASAGCCNTCFASWSTGGTQAAGGNDAVGSNTCCIFTPTANGALGVGANGAGPSASCNNGDGGGGGGGGYYGGGAGGGYGSGSGGSSYTNASCGNVTHTQGYQAGNGYVTLNYGIVVLAITNTAFQVSAISCNGSSNGSAATIISGSIPPYTYSWSAGNQTKDTATGLSAGTYTVTVHDPCGNSSSATVTITQPNPLTVSASPLGNVSCNGGNNGTASSTVNGGTGPYTYTWSPAGGNGATGIGLSAGVYSLNVKDNHGCTGSATATITQPAPLSITATTTANIPCYGDNNGTTLGTAHSGTPPYNYVWAPTGGNLATAVGLAPGVYTVTLTDNNGCTGSARTTVTQPAAALTTAITAITNVLCNPGSTGSISSSTAGGTLPYTYSWTGGQTNAMANALTAGSYTLNITDAHGCKVAAAATVTQPSGVTVTKMVSPDDGACTGSAWVMVNGGVLPYTYLWSNGNTTAYAHDVCGDTAYCCKITDANGCSESACVTVDNDAGVANISSGSGKVTVYPNPTSGQFTIQLSGISSQWSVEVYNVLGEKVYSQSSITNATSNINLGNQPNGIYLYRIVSSTNGNMIGQGKIVLEK